MITAFRVSREAFHRYFDLIGRMQSAIADRKYDDVARVISQTFEVVEHWLKENINEYGQFVTVLIPVFEQAGQILPYFGRDANLAAIESIVARHSEREPWREIIAWSFSFTTIRR